MIVREKPQAWQLLFVLRGSIVPAIAPRVAIVTLLSAGVVVLQGAGLLRIHDATALPFSLIGIALSIFAGFRNSACYDRWWEGRKIFGQLLVECRCLAREQIAWWGPADPAAARRAALRCAAFAYLLRDAMRGTAPGEEALALLDDRDRALVRAAHHPANRLLAQMSVELFDALKRDLVVPHIAQVAEERIVSLSGILAGAERIRGVPVPYTYSLLLHRVAWLFCLLLPFGLVPAAGPWTPLIVAIVSYTFFGLDALGEELEAPFGLGQNALPLDALTRTVEIDIRDMLGDAELPKPVQPIRFILT